MQARRPRSFVLLPTMPPPTNHVLAIYSDRPSYMRVSPSFSACACNARRPGIFALLPTMPPPTKYVLAILCTWGFRPHWLQIHMVADCTHFWTKLKVLIISNLVFQSCDFQNFKFKLWNFKFAFSISKCGCAFHPHPCTCKSYAITSRLSVPRAINPAWLNIIFNLLSERTRTLSQAGFIACYIIFWYRAALQFSDYSGRRPIKVNVHGTSASSPAQAEKDVIQESWIKGCAIQADVAPAARAHPLLHPGITPCVDCCTLLVKTIPVPVVQRSHGGAAFLSLVVHLGVFWGALLSLVAAGLCLAFVSCLPVCTWLHVHVFCHFLLAGHCSRRVVWWRFKNCWRCNMNDDVQGMSFLCLQRIERKKERKKERKEERKEWRKKARPKGRKE